MGFLQGLIGRFTSARPPAAQREAAPSAPLPSQARLCYERAVAAMAAGDAPGAAELLRQAVALRRGADDFPPEAQRLLARVSRLPGAGGGAALAALQAVLAADPASNVSGRWIAEGNTALQAWNLDQAADCYLLAQLADPADPMARLNRGFVALEQGQAAQAIELLTQALALRAEGGFSIADAHFLLGRAHRLQGAADQALAAFEAAVAVRPDFAEPMEEALALLQELERHEETLAWARRLQGAKPTPSAELAIAKALSDLDRDGEALSLLDSMLARDPDQADAWAGRGSVLLELDRAPEALAAFERALAIAGQTPAARTNVGSALSRLGRTEEALGWLRGVLKEDPRHRSAAYCHVVTLLEALRLPEAVAAAQGALAFRPQDGDIQWLLAVARLLQRDFEQGWPLMEWRWQTRTKAGRLPPYPGPQWHGSEDLSGKTLLVFAEQGYGDSIQFLRFVPAVAAKAARVLLLLQPGMEELAGAAGLPGNCVLVPPGSPLAVYDLQLPLMSLPLVLGTREATIPREIPYLRGDPARTEAWRRRLAADAGGRLKVGVAWSGNAAHRNDRNRSMTLQRLRTLETEGCRFVSLQPQVRASDQQALDQWPELLQYGPELRTFVDTASLMEALDVIVAVDTSVVHLAGALGRPVRVLLAYYPDWRWMLDRQDSPWYPTAKLHRQPAPGDWDAVLAEVRADLEALAAGVGVRM